MRIASVQGLVSAQVSGQAPVAAPQALWPGNVDSYRIGFQIWPGNDGNADSYNVYRQDVSSVTPYVSGLLFHTVPNSRPVPQVYFQDSQVLTPSTTYTYWATAVRGGIESAFSSTLTLTTLAAGPGATLPTKPTVPETYITTPPASWNPPAGGTIWTPTTGALLNTAFSSAVPGDLIVVQAGTIYTSATGPTAFTISASGTAALPINVISSEEPVFKSGGKLIPYVPYSTAQRNYVSFTLQTPLPAAGVLTATLSAPWPNRTGYFPCVFRTSAAANFETRLVHFVSGSSAIRWEQGFLNGGPLLGAITSATFLVDVASYVTADDVSVVGALPTLNFTYPGNSGIGLNITGSFIRVVGLAVVPTPSQTVTHTGTAAVQISGNNVTLDRCVIGNDTGLATWSPLTRGVTATGNNLVGHQCFIYGIHYGIPNNSSNTTGDTQAWWSAANGPHCVESSFTECTSENMMSGGVFTAQASLAHDCTFRGNYNWKNGAWNGNEFGAYIKNLHELKAAQRMEMYNNIYQGSWEAWGTPGQHGHCFQWGTIDNSISQATRTITAASWASGTATVTASFYCSGMVANQQFTATVASVNPAGYNGTFLCTVISAATGTFSYALATNPGVYVSGGNASVNALMGCPWFTVSDISAHDNQVYGVATLCNIHNDEGQQTSGHSMRINVSNNYAWINPQANGQQTVTATTNASGVTATGFTFTSLVQANSTFTTWPMGTISPAGQTGFVILSTGQIISGITINGGGVVVSWPSTTITGAPTNSVTIVCHRALSFANGLKGEAFVPDVTFDHNTIITIPNKTGYLDTSPAQQTNGVLYYTQGAPDQIDRHVVTNNVIDGTIAFNAQSIQGGTFQGSGPSAITTMFHSSCVWSNNATILDNAAYPNPAAGTGNGVGYAALFGAGFPGNTVMPFPISQWNVTQAPYATASLTGTAVGANSAPQITTTSLPNAVVGTAYSQALAATGGSPPYTWNKVSITPNTLLAMTVSPSGVVQGNPQCTETQSIVVQVNDAAGQSGQATLTLACISSGALTVVTTTLPNYTSGAMYYGQLIASGGVAPYVWSSSPPAGVIVQRSGQVSVDSVAAGPFTFTATVTDATGAAATSGTLTITVDSVLRLMNVDPIDGFIRLPDGYAGTLYGQAKPRFMAFGGTAPYTFSLASGSTNGLTVVSDGSLRGTPTGAGALNFSVTVTDSATPTAATFTAPVLLNVLSKDQVARPSYNTGAGYFVNSDGTFRDPSGFRFTMRGMNRDHFDNACMPSMAVIGANACRYTAFTFNVAVPASSYESGMNTDHIGNKEFVYLAGFFVVGTNTQLSGRSTPSDIQGLCDYYNQNIATFNPIMNKMGLNIANEWGAGTQSLSGNALFLQTYDGALVNITSIAGTTINFTSSAAVNPLASQTFGWITGVTGLTNQTIGLSGAAGTGPNYSIVSSVNLGTFGAGGQLGGGAVCALRAGGWTCPLIIDECGRNGQNQGNILGGNAAIVNGHDPQHNCIFTTHPYNVPGPGRAQITSVTSSGANTVLHFNSSAATNPFSNMGNLPACGITLIGMQGGTWSNVNGQNFSISPGGGAFSGSAGSWAVTIPLNSAALGTYTANSGWAFDTYNPAIAAENFADLSAQGVCVMFEEFGPVTNSPPTPTILAPTDVIQAAEAYGISWLMWAYDDGSPFGLMTTLPAPNFSVANLSSYAGQAFVMHGRMNWAALAASPPVLLP